MSLQGRCVGNNWLLVRAWYKAPTSTTTTTTTTWYKAPAPPPHLFQTQCHSTLRDHRRCSAAIKTDIFWWCGVLGAGGDRAGAAQQGTWGEAVMRRQRRRPLEQWLWPDLSDKLGCKFDRSERFQPEIQGSKDWGDAPHISLKVFISKRTYMYLYVYLPVMYLPLI